jgi:hypothetical protein
VVVVLQEGCAGGVRGVSTTDKDIKTKEKCQLDVAATEEKEELAKTNSAEICNPFGCRCLLFICQICNFNQNRVERCLNVPLGLLLFPLVTRRKGGKKDLKKKKSITSVSFSARSWPTNLLTQLQQRFT